MQEVIRQEKKYGLTFDEYRKASFYFDRILTADQHNGEGAYLVRSLYFDTLEDEDYYDKLDGIELRRKIRLRIYSPDSDYALLENKQKQGAYQKKRSLKIKRRDAQALCEGRYESLLDYAGTKPGSMGEEFAAELYALMQMNCYRPKTVIEYKRRAYCVPENKIRITFDSEIKATESCYDIFSPDLSLNNVLDPFQLIMEVKYNHFLLSYIKEIIDSVDKSELSYSKYMLGRYINY